MADKSIRKVAIVAEASSSIDDAAAIVCAATQSSHVNLVSGSTGGIELAISQSLALNGRLQERVNQAIDTIKEDFVQKMASDRGGDVAQVEREFFESVRPSSMIKRSATSKEVAALVTYVSSPLSSVTNGAALQVDGGVVRSIL